MFCLKCGKEIENNAVFCPFCGGKQPKASWVEPSEPARTQEPGTEPHTERTPEPGTELHTARTPEPGTEQQTARTPEPGTKPQAAPDRAEPAPSASNKFERIIETGCGAIGLALLITAVMRPVAWVLKSIPFQSLFRALPGWDLMPYAAQDFIIRMPNPFSLLGSVLSGVRVVLLVLILVAAVFLFFSLIYVLIRHCEVQADGRKRGVVMPIIAMCVCLAVFVSALFALIQRFTVVRVILMIVAALFGADLALRTFVLKTAMDGAFHPIRDIGNAKTSMRQPHAVDRSMYTDPNLPAYEMTPEIEGGESYFDGKGIQYLGLSLLRFLVSSITCTIAWPWMQARIIKWETEHTVLDGRRLSFNGTGTQLFVESLKWMLFSLVTCGIYAVFFRPAAYRKWVLSHTTYSGMERGDNEPYANSGFDAIGPEYAGYNSFAATVSGITCMLGAPWAETVKMRWERRHMVVERNRFFYDGTGMGLFGVMAVNLLLTLVTCSVFSWWAYCRTLRYVICHTHVDATRIG